MELTNDISVAVETTVPAINTATPSPEIIHLVLGKANPQRMNGVNRVVCQLAQKQAEAGKQVSVWGITIDPEHNYGYRSFETRLFKASSIPFGISRELKEALIAKQGKAVFHLHGGWIPAFAHISSVLARHHIPFVLTPHGAYNRIAMQRSKWIKKFYFHFFEKDLLFRANRIHCIGQSEVAGTNYLYPTQKTFLLPYGFEADTLQTENHLSSDDHFIIGYVGRLDIYTKGLDLLLDAFESFYAAEPDSRLWIVGDGAQREELEDMIAARGLEHGVVLWGSMFGQDKDELMMQMNVFAHPSRNEGLPAAILEASALGIPSVVTHATNVGTMISAYACGIAVENENAEALANALFRLKKQWNTGELAEMGKRAKRMVNTVFNWTNLIPEFDKLYQPA